MPDRRATRGLAAESAIVANSRAICTILIGRTIGLADRKEASVLVQPRAVESVDHDHHQDRDQDRGHHDHIGRDRDQDRNERRRCSVC